MKELIVAVQTIREHQKTAVPRIFSEADFANIDRQLTPLYSQIDSSQSAERSQELARQACQLVSTSFDQALKNWATDNNKRVANMVGAPARVTFRVKTSQPGALVELLGAADMVLTLLKQNESVAPLSSAGLSLLDASPLWERLPMEGAFAYGNFYYRYATVDAIGNFQSSPFSLQRKIKIIKAPESGEILFP